MRLLELENRCPDFVSIQLEAIAAQSNDNESNKFDLYWNISFKPQWQSLLDGRVKLGLKGGKLNLTLDNGKFTRINRQLARELTITAAETTKTNVSWLLEIEAGKSVLTGSFRGIELGTIEAIAHPCSLAVTFTVDSAAVCVSDTEDLWSHNISPNKHAVLERKLSLFLWENQLTPYLSWAQLASGELESWQSLGEKNRQTISYSRLSQLKDLTQQIYAAKTNDLLELTRLAGLNPLTDFAGGNLLGADLNNTNLSGANLTRANLRGANLTDADLSEANLSHAKLSGADLSGAYLDNADLSHADLHRASLVLANLSNVNLSNANLEEANLSNTNLSGIKIAAAKLGNNPGISERTKLSLEQQGAIWDDISLKGDRSFS
ncbi:pentapeptide repeat-containing protein [Pleurocapsales cyanobacterium LEGE 06147]|nr:pentapeptide repeat-containing protein [Pleurocapsales cyanobacterium LEGE 06147]